MQPAAVLAAVVKVQGVKSANVALAGFNTNLERTSTYAASTAAASSKAGKYLKAGITVGAVGAAYGLIKAISAGAKFERQIDTLGAVTETSTAKLKKMETQGLKLGESTQYTANQVVEAQVELAKGGLNIEQIYGGGIQAALSLAAAGGLELGEAAEYTVNAMKLFGLNGKEAKHVADLFAIAANKTTADVQDFGMAMKQGGSVAKIAGYNITEATTTLEALAEAGIKNSDAGTSMKTSIIQLLKPSSKQKDLADELNIVWTNQEGKLKNAAELSAELHRATDGLAGGTKKMTDAERAKTFATLAGTDGVRTLASLYQKTPKQLEKMEHGLEKTGVAEKIASERMDNLQGDAEQLQGAFETVGIKLERELAPALRTTTQFLTEVVVAVSNFDFAGAAEEVDNFVESNEYVQAAVGGWEEIQGATESATEWSINNVPGMWEEVSAATVEGAETIKNIAGPVIEELIPIWEQAGEGIIQYVEGWWQTVTSIFNRDPSGVLDGLKTMFGGALKILGAGLQYILVEIKTVGRIFGVIFAPVIDWIKKAYENTEHWVTSLIPVKLAIISFALQFGPLLIVLKGLISYLKVIVNYFTSNWLVAVKASAAILSGVFTYALKNTMAIISAFWTNIKNLGTVIGDVISFVSHILHGEWGAAWDSAKKIVADWWKMVKGIVMGAWTVLKTQFSTGMDLIKKIFTTGWGAVKDIFTNTAEAFGEAFETSWDTVKGLFESGLGVIEDVVNKIIDVINLIPGVDIEHINSKEGTRAGSGGKKHQSKAGYYEGGAITKPTAIVGEEAPMHNEWVIATNPAYKKANLGYWAQAGSDLGVPGFASGGLMSGMSGVMNTGLLNPVEDIEKAAGAVGNVAKGAGEIGLNAAKGTLKYGEELVGKGAQFLIDKLPKPDVPYPLEKTGQFAVDKAAEYIKSWFGSDQAKKYKKSGALGSGKVGGSVADHPELQAGISAIVATVLKKFPGLSITSTTGGVHAANSLHYQGRAADLGASIPYMDTAAGWIKSNIGAQLTEGIHNPNLSVADGREVSSGYWGAETWADHIDHIHLGKYKGGLLQYFAEGGKFAPGNYTVKHESASAQQQHTAKEIMEAADYTGATQPPRIASLMAATQESAMGATGNTFQLTGDFEGVSPSDNAYKQAVQWYTKGYYSGPVLGSGGGIAKAKKSHDLGLVAQEVEGSAYPTLYSQWESEGRTWAEGWNKNGKGGKAEETPHEEAVKSKRESAEQKQREGKHRKASREAQLAKLEKAVNEVKTDPAKKSKLWHLTEFWARNGMFEKAEREYFAGKVRDVASQPKASTQVSMLKNLTGWLKSNGEITGKDPSQFRDLTAGIDKAKEDGKAARDKTLEKQKARREAKHNKLVAKLEARGEFPGIVEQMERFRSNTEKQEEYASQLSSLQPEDVSDEYVHSEIAAWESALDNVGNWRNTILTDKGVVNERIFRLNNDINNIKVYKPEKGAIQTKAWTKIWEKNKWKIPIYEKDIEVAKQFRDETLAGEMNELSPQTPTGMISPLPRNPVAGAFGGRVFDMQNTIRELGLPTEPNGSASTAAEEAAEAGAKAQLEWEAKEAMEWKKRFLATQYQSEVLKKYPTVQDLGALPGYALGGQMMEDAAWVGERGKELFVGGAGGTVVNARESAQITGDHQGGPIVIEALNVYADDGTADVTIDGVTSPAVVKKVTRKQARDSMSPTPGGTTR